MHIVKLGAAALNQIPLDWDGNVARIREAIAQARAAGVSILCLPELCISGYGCEDAFLSPGVQHTAAVVLRDLVAETRDMAVCFGLPLYRDKGVYNAVAVAVNGSLVGFVPKQHLAGDGLHYEPRWFKPWPSGSVAEVEVEGERYPIGDLAFDIGGVRVGFEICEDAWVAHRPGGDLAMRSVDIILNPSASHFAFGKHEIRKRFVAEGSRAFGVAYVYANLLGNEAGRTIYDGDTHIAVGGAVVASGRRFSFEDCELITASVDLDLSRTMQTRTASFQPRVEGNGKEVAVAFEFPAREPEPPTASRETWETTSELKEESFARVIALGLFDYMRKSRSRGFVVSLSGGADSAAVSCLVWTMCKLVTDELGPGGVAKRLEFLNLAEGTAEELCHNLLTCVYQSTRNSGAVTRDAATQLAHAIGAQFHELDVDAIVESYTGLVSGALGRNLAWETDDIALQNIQARVRGPSVWMLANISGALLLATSNRSEAAVGYATMDGDTCGGLSPIAGIDKAFLLHWLRWMETVGPRGLGAIPALHAINAQQPTAELRPPSAGQTDEGDLMPYPVLEAIEDAAIRDKCTPVEVFRGLRVAFPDVTVTELAGWVRRFFTLWARNQWKRERYAPALHVDDKNLDPRSWCRFPILSGGFQRELREFDDYIAEL